MAPKARNKQSVRGPSKRLSSTFSALETTEISRAEQQSTDEFYSDEVNGDIPPTQPLKASQVTLEATELGELGELDELDEGLQDFEFDNLEHSAAQSKVSRIQGDRHKSFAWSDAGSVSRRSTPVHGGETPLADWQLNDSASVPDLLSSPRSGTGNPPSTWPVPEHILNHQVLPEIQATTPCVDFSETATSARRSSPIDPDEEFDELFWHLDPSAPATPHQAPSPPSAPSSLKSAISTAKVQPVTELKPLPTPLDLPDDEGNIATPDEVFHQMPSMAGVETTSGKMATHTESNTKLPRNRRKQRAKSPVKVDEATQRVNITPLSLTAGDGKSVSATKDPSSLQDKPVPTKLSGSTKSQARQPGAALKKARHPAGADSTSKKARGPKKAGNDDPNSSWKPPQPKVATAPDQVIDGGRLIASDAIGPAANTRARGKNLHASTAKTNMESAEKKHTQVNRPEEIDPPSGGSATSVGNDPSPNTDFDSEYFVVPAGDKSVSPKRGSLTQTIQDGEGNQPNLRSRSGIESENEDELEPIAQVVASARTKLVDRMQPPTSPASSTKAKPAARPTKNTKSATLNEPSVASKINARHVKDSPRVAPPATKTQHPMAQPAARSMKVQVAASIVATQGKPIKAQETIKMQDTAKTLETIYLSSDPESAEEDVDDDDENRGDVSDHINDGSDRTTDHSQVCDSVVTPEEPQPAIAAITVTRKLFQDPQKPVAQIAQQEPLVDVRSQGVVLLERDTNIVTRRPLPKKRSISRAISISVKGSPVPLQDLRQKRKRDAQDSSSNLTEPHFDVPPALPHYDRTVTNADDGEAPAPMRKAFRDLGPKAKRSKREQLPPDVGHLVAESHHMIEDINKRLENLASNFHATGRVYDANMQKTITKIEQRGYEERTRLEKVNRCNVRAFLSLVDAARETVDTQATERGRRMARLQVAWEERQKSYDVAISQLLGFKRSLEFDDRSG